MLDEKTLDVQIVQKIDTDKTYGFSEWEEKYHIKRGVGKARQFVNWRPKDNFSQKTLEYLVTTT